MRKFLITIAILAGLIAASSALWIFRGQEISSLVDRYWTIETRSMPIHSIGYEGTGAGGVLIVNDVSLGLNDIRPGLSLSVGSTKDNQLGLASGGRVFAFGPLSTNAEDSSHHLAASPAAGDQAFLAVRHSVLSWPTPFDLNFLSGRSPSWKRQIYHEIGWEKSSGAKLKMLWRYEQFFYPGNGWASGFMTREGSTGLIQVEIKK